MLYWENIVRNNNNNKWNQIWQKKYKKCVRKLLHSKLTSKSLILAINTYAVPLLRYSRDIVKWTQAEI